MVAPKYELTQYTYGDFEVILENKMIIIWSFDLLKKKYEHFCFSYV